MILVRPGRRHSLTGIYKTDEARTRGVLAWITTEVRIMADGPVSRILYRTQIREANRVPRRSFL